MLAFSGVVFAFLVILFVTLLVVAFGMISLVMFTTMLQVENLRLLKIVTLTSDREKAEGTDTGQEMTQ